MNVTDNFLQEKAFKDLQDFTLSNQFETISYGEKQFSVLQTPNEFLPFLNLKGYELVLTFIRSAYNGFDEDTNIHADGIINGHKIDKAAVLYINEREGVTLNGTCFYTHQKHGRELPFDISYEEYDRLLKEDSSNKDVWEMTDSITSFPNRFLSYNSNYFHSKVPAQIKKGTRITLVAFYKKLNK